MKFFVLCLVCLTATYLPAAESKNHVVILLDTSGSMEESMRTVRQQKMDAARNSLAAVVDQIPTGTQVGLVTFGGWVYELGEMDRDKLKAAILSAEVTMQSGTPLGTYMKIGADRLLQEREKSLGYGTYKLLVVTDGEPTNEPPDCVDRFLGDILRRGLTVQCIGVAMADNHSLAKRVHSYMRADDPQTLQQSLNKVLGEVQAKDDKLATEMFEDLKSIPTPVAKDVIAALSNSDNYPIGEAPPVKQNMDESPEQQNMDESPEQQNMDESPEQQNVGTPLAPQKSSGSWTPMIVLIVLVCIILLLINNR